MNILEIKQLTVAFEGHPPYFALNDLNLQLKQGQCLGLVGESGSGKTITALSILQLLPQGARVFKDSRIIFENEDLLNFSERQMRSIRGKRIGLIFQDAMSAFNPVLTIGYQLYEVVPNKKSIFKLFKEVGIDDVARCYRAYPHELSGGQRQRAMIAMALAGNPDILIADEPTTALDLTIQAQIVSLLADFKRKNKTLLFIGHDLSLVAQLADEMLVLKRGKKMEEGLTDAFFSHPQKAYTKSLIQAVLPNSPQHLKVDSRPALLQVKHLKLYFPVRSGFLRRKISNIKAVDDISLNIPFGQTLALVGESGSGKSTAARAIMRLIPPDEGQILFKGVDLLALSSAQMRRMRGQMQIIFQDPYASLDPRMMIGDCIIEGLIAQNKIQSATKLAKKLDSILEDVQLAKQAKWHYPHEFSGGQRQRIAIARALALEPRLLILDEPTSALDVSIQHQILNLLQELQQRLDLSYLLITHNIAIVAYMAHYLAVMNQGKIVEQGIAANIINKPEHPYTEKFLQSVPKHL